MPYYINHSPLIALRVPISWLFPSYALIVMRSHDRKRLTVDPRIQYDEKSKIVSFNQ